MCDCCFIQNNSAPNNAVSLAQFNSILGDLKENLGIKKEIYSETQNWARHNETMIVATNTILLGATAAIASNYLKTVAPQNFIFPMFLAFIPLIGLIITWYLTGQYKNAISRIIVYETCFGLHGNCEVTNSALEILQSPSIKKKWCKGQEETPFVPKYLHNLSWYGAMSTPIFSTINFALIGFIIYYHFYT